MFCNDLLDEKFFLEELDDGKVCKITWGRALLYGFVDCVLFGLKWGFFLFFGWFLVSFFVKVYLLDVVVPLCPLLVN